MRFVYCQENEATDYNDKEHDGNDTIGGLGYPFGFTHEVAVTDEAAHVDAKGGNQAQGIHVG